MQAALASSIGFGLTAGACHALGVSRASLYRGRARLVQPSASPPPTKPRSPRALSAEQRRAVLDRLREPRFVDLAPAEIYATLLDEGTYQCSIRTMYRILAEQAPSANAATSCAIPSIKSPNCWPKLPIKSGHGTSAILSASRLP